MEEKTKRSSLSLVLFFMLNTILIALITLFGIVPILQSGFTCDDCYCIEGTLVGYSSKSPYHFNMDIGADYGSDTFYCSEGFPDDFESYFGKNVRICGMSGCGRTSIDSIDIIN